MKLSSLFCDSCDFVRRRIYLILWISLVVYLFYDSFVYYETGMQFRCLRRLLGVGLCISRATATVINLCGALILLPLCKKLNQLWYKILSRICPRLFFLWLEKAKSFHITVAITLVFFAVLHSISHLVNLWHFSRGYDPKYEDVNLVNYRNENPLNLLLSVPGVTGLLMLFILLLMATTSLRVVRRNMYHVFWCTHQMYLVFVLLLIVHPLSGVLKEEVLTEASHNSHYNLDTPKYIPIKSKTLSWMSVPLAFYFVDLMWRIFTRNRSSFSIIEVNHMCGRTISLTIACPKLRCRIGQYVLLQCLDVSVIEWHPFTVVKVPTLYQRSFVVWIRVKGDWTNALEKLLLQKRFNDIRILVDGPFSSPMEDVCRSSVAICIAAGVGITPFVPVLRNMLLNPRNRLPGRLHLIWIVRNEQEITWLADLATKTMLELRNSNKPDRLHLELYVTSENTLNDDKNLNPKAQLIVNERGLSNITDERISLLTPHLKRHNTVNVNINNIGDARYSIAKDYPLLGCRVRRGRPHWDRVFGYWVHLYPEYHLNLYCCGPKQLVKSLRKQCELSSKTSRTHFTFVHEGFS